MREVLLSQLKDEKTVDKSSKSYWKAVQPTAQS